MKKSRNTINIYEIKKDCEKEAITRYDQTIEQIKKDFNYEKDLYYTILQNEYLREYNLRLEGVIDVYEKCPGLNKCHGSLKWCSLCEEVDNICDYPKCDIHLRKDEVRDLLKIDELEIRKEVEKYFKIVYENQDNLDNFRIELETLSHSIKKIERDINENKETLNSYEYKYKMVPREKEKYDDFGQLKLVF